jgi:lysophospholipase L1-like esterase
MNQARTSWMLIGISSLIVTLVLLAGFIYAVKDILYPQASEELQYRSQKSGQMDSNKLLIVGLGDSLTKGIGDETGKGYIGHLKDELTVANDKQVSIIGNLAVSGHRSDQLQDVLKQAGVRYTISKANMIVLTIGGNDLFSVGQDEVDVSLIETRMPDALARLADTLKTINTINPKAQLYYTGLYNPFSELDNGMQSSQAVQTWNFEVFALINQYPQMTFVPSFDLFSKNPKAYLASDQFHPNEMGYERIAKRIAQVVE